MDNIIVYTRVNGYGVITDINSSLFLRDTTGWIEIDSGTGDRYAHAQGNYLAGGLVDSNGIYNYKLVDGVVVLRTNSEKAVDISDIAPTMTEDERLTMLEDAFAELAMMLL